MMKPSRCLLTVAIAVTVLAGCGNGQPPATSPTTGPAPTTPGVAPTALGTMVTATLTDYKISLSQTSFTAGSYTFVATQAGQLPHSLAVKGPGVDQASAAPIQPGGASEQLTVTLQPGTYELWCPVGNHRAQGMVMTITVA